MKFSVLTLFPEMFDVIKTSIIGKAIENIYQNFDEYNQKLKNMRDYFINEMEKIYGRKIKK